LYEEPFAWRIGLDFELGLLSCFRDEALDDGTRGAAVHARHVLCEVTSNIQNSLPKGSKTFLCTAILRRCPKKGRRSNHHSHLAKFTPPQRCNNMKTVTGSSNNCILPPSGANKDEALSISLS
jgi:hypothetical protein